MTNQELYNEEQRQLMIEVRDGLYKMAEALEMFTAKYEQPKEEVSIKGQVEVNTQDSVKVENLKDINFKEEAKEITEAIKNSKVKSVTVENIKDAIPKEIKVTNQKNYDKDLKNIVQAIQDQRLEVTTKETKFPDSPRNYVSVRLTDGKAFYNALTTVGQAIANIPLVRSTVTGEFSVAVANADGSAIEGGTSTVDTSNLLLETGDALLLESGDLLLTE